MKERIEPLWHMELAVLALIGLQILLGDRFSPGPKYFIVVLECLQLIVLILIRNSGHPEKERWHWRMMLLLTAFVSAVNTSSLLLVMRALVAHPAGLSGQTLILSALATYATNVIVFGLWYWQLDGGGPGGRGSHQPPIDFLFTQMVTDSTITKEPGWRPAFFDYLYLSITNATAFSPTDVLPLTHRAKLLMSIQSFTAFATVAVVAARAINILA